MLNTISRPNFFPGQLIDYKDFNRLAEQADQTISLLCGHLYAGGGIVVKALEEFAVVPMEGLSVRVKPGIAVLPSGQVLVLNSDKVVDFGLQAEGKSTKTLVVSVRNQVKGSDRYRDDDDTTITGYRTEIFDPELVVSARKPVPDSLELFRVTLNPGAQGLRHSDIDEEWSLKPLKREGKGDGVIDLRYRRRIVPHTLNPIEVNELIKLRQSLYSLEDVHRKIAKIFLVEDTFQTAHYLSQLHAELLNVPFQPLKVAFLVSEYAKKLSQYLEYLSYRLGKQHTNFDKTTVLNILESLERMRSRDVLPRESNFQELLSVSKMLESVLSFAEKKYNLLNAIEEGLLDMRTRLVAYDARLSLGGHVLQRVDSVSVSDSDRYQVKSDSSHVRSVTAAFSNGDRLNLKGVFIKNGVVTADVNVPNPDRPLILISQRYVRRGGTQLHYEINGKHLVSEQGSDLQLANNWMNHGLVVPANHLVAHENRFRIRVEKSDLDFGFFGLSVYQPVQDKGVKS